MIIPLGLHPRSLTGHSLAGDRLVRFLYVDEAGYSANEPVTVVAGIIVHADSQWKSLEQYRADLIREFIPAADRNGFVFHATELFSGGRYFKRDKWPLSIRMKILKSMLHAIPLHCVPFVVGRCAKDPTKKSKGNAQFCHMSSYLSCVAGAEDYMRKAASGEVCLVVAEDNTNNRGRIRQVHHKLISVDGYSVYRELMPVRHIVDTVHFAEKPNSALLQFSDAIAFTFRRYVSQQSHADELLAELGGNGIEKVISGTNAGYSVVTYTKTIPMADASGASVGRAS